jgi:hypothetical protein
VQKGTGRKPAAAPSFGAAGCCLGAHSLGSGRNT